VVRRNVAAVDAALDHLSEVPVPGEATAARHRRPAVPAHAPEFVQRVTRLLLEGHGDRLPVSAFPPDGTWPTGTSKWEKRGIAREIPIWDAGLCIECNRCSMICPHSAIRTKVYEPEALAGAPGAFPSISVKHMAGLAGLSYTVQVAPEDCTGCGVCVEVCPAKDHKNPKHRSIDMRPATEHLETERARFEFLESIPELSRARLAVEPKSLPLVQPLFEFSGACAGCGETPYIRLLTQLLGDRLLIANATGCSSIYGGNLPTTPYTVDAAGRGPAWNNSLFEDAAEFGLGMRLSADALEQRARKLLGELAPRLSTDLIEALRSPCATVDEAAIEQRRTAVVALRAALAPHGDDAAATELARLADALVPKSVWVIGGDGWAYDIGFGGLDHVLSTGKNIKLLVLDTEVYSNTGGQASKATPMGALAKYAAAGKERRKKDLGLYAMSYGNVYVASVAMQARSAQTVDALREAESYDGPAIVIAHSPCVAHGYDLAHAPAQQRAAIESWAWPIYRYDPRRGAEGKPPLSLDSVPMKLPVRSYMQEEARFRMVELRDPERYERLVRLAEEGVAERRSLYMQLAGIRVAGTEKNGHG
jgi:pyruvate-ferredoxin/flavodoxin oxidoreductase